MTGNPPQHGGYQCCTQNLKRYFAILQTQLFSGALCWRSTFLFKISQRCSIRFKLGDILRQVIVFTDFGSVLWTVMLDILLPSFWRLGVILSACILVYPQALMV